MECNNLHNNSQIETFINSLNFSWQDLIEIFPVGILLFDSDWKIKSYNKNFVELFGINLVNKSIVGMNLFSANILSDKIPLEEISQMKEGKDFEKRLKFDLYDDKPYQLIIKGSPLSKNDVFQGGILILEDYKIMDDVSFDIKDKKSSIFKFLNNICSCFLVFDLEGRLKYTSEGPSEECVEFSGKSNLLFSDLFTSEVEMDTMSMFQKVIKSNEIKFTELIYFSDTDRIKYKSVLVPFSDSKDMVKSLIVLLRDKNNPIIDTISFLSNSSTLKEFESFAKIAMDGLLKLNLHGNITYWTENAENLFNTVESKIITKFIGNLFPEITIERFAEIRSKIFDDGFWEGYLLSDLVMSENILKVKIISKIENNITDLYVYCTKIDKKQQQIISAREEEKIFFKDAVVKSNQMILQTNPHGTVLFANEKFCDLFEYDQDEIRGTYFLDLIEESYRTKRDLFDFEKFIQNEELEIIKFESKSKKIIEASCTINISTFANELKYFTIYIREGSSNEKLLVDTAHTLLYSFPNPLLIVRENLIVKVNPKFCEAFGSQFETDFFGLPFNEILTPSSFEKAKILLERNTLSEERAELSFIRKNKTVFKAGLNKLFTSKNNSFSVLFLELEDMPASYYEDETDIIKKELGKIGPYYWKGTYKSNEFRINYIDEIISEITGYPHHAFIEKIDFLKEITRPDDVDKFFDHIENLDKTTLDQVKEITYRLIKSDGEIIWIKNRYKIKFKDTNNLEIYGSISNVTDWTLEREELRSIITELDKLNTAKEKFISIISHDLKSPFTSIVGFSELILTDTSLSKEDILDYVGHIKDASLHTVDLLNGLLDLTKLQTGRIEVEPKIINASYMAKKSVEILSGLAFQKGLSLSSSVDNSLYIMADDNLLFQVFNNLVANSIKFTPRGGKIEISSREIPGQQKVEFSVKDTGVGIEHEDISKLFVIDKKFTTLGTDGERGTGLGLTLVKEIIDKHGGKIEVKSEINAGTEFIFSLPLSTPTILIIDANQAERVIYSKLLESITNDIEIVQASNEEEAIQKAKEKMPMLIIFEHKLPRITGDEFIGELKKAGLIYEPSLMILTKYYSEELRRSYIDIGVNEVFSKPFELKKFKAHLDKLIGRIE